MAEYKVLGASPRNLTAIKNALSFNNSTCYVGSVKPDFHFKDEEEQVEIELPSGICLLIAVNGVLSGVPLSVSGGVIAIETDETYEPGDPRYYTINYKPIRYC